MFDYIDFSYIALIDHLGTFAFALSGIRLASLKNFDWFGAYVVGLVTATGGGTMRDVLLGVSPFWMGQSSYLVITAIALIVFLLFAKPLTHLKITLFLFDTIGLGLFTVVGIEKTLTVGFPFWVAVIMGAMTGSIGGVIRDVLINETPLIFRREIYALACVAGGFAYYIGYFFDFSTNITWSIAALTVISTRVLAVVFHIHVPRLVPKMGEDPPVNPENKT